MSLAEAEGLRALLHSLNAHEAAAPPRAEHGAEYGDAAAASPIGGATFSLRFGGDAVEVSPRHRAGPAHQVRVRVTVRVTVRVRDGVTVRVSVRVVAVVPLSQAPLKRQSSSSSSSSRRMGGRGDGGGSAGCCALSGLG